MRLTKLLHGLSELQPSQGRTGGAEHPCVKLCVPPAALGPRMHAACPTPEGQAAGT